MATLAAKTVRYPLTAGELPDLLAQGDLHRSLGLRPAIVDTSTLDMEECTESAPTKRM
jgi:hypothetical protein